MHATLPEGPYNQAPPASWLEGAFGSRGVGLEIFFDQAITHTTRIAPPAMTIVKFYRDPIRKIGFRLISLKKYLLDCFFNKIYFDIFRRICLFFYYSSLNYKKKKKVKKQNYLEINFYFLEYIIIIRFSYKFSTEMEIVY